MSVFMVTASLCGPPLPRRTLTPTQPSLFEGNQDGIQMEPRWNFTAWSSPPPAEGKPMGDADRGVRRHGEIHARLHRPILLPSLSRIGCLHNLASASLSGLSFSLCFTH